MKDIKTMTDQELLNAITQAMDEAETEDWNLIAPYHDELMSRHPGQVIVGDTSYTKKQGPVH